MINWKIRFKNPQFLFQLFLSMAVPILTYFGLEFSDMTTWGSVFSTLVDAISNPFVIGMVIVSVYNALSDPTTRGIGDSERALNYNTPVDTKNKSK